MIPNFTSYTVIEPLGQGGMATVYLAEHQLLGNKVAIKVLNDEFVRNQHIRKRFMAEARNLARMSHTNIIKVTDLIDQDDLVIFVMEYIEGQTLKDYLDKKEKLPDEEIKQLFTQMLDAVGYVHEQGLIHRDIKPSNFMISQKGVVKLLDFGISKNTDIKSAEYTMTGTSQNMGTPMYMSPEQVKSTKDVTFQSDIYSLGVVLWQMVMGKKPYDTNSLSTFELQTKIVKVKLAQTKTKWDDIIERATEKKIEQRFESAKGFLDAIEQIEDLQKTRNSNTSDETILIENSVFEDKTEVSNSSWRSPKKSEQKTSISTIKISHKETIYNNDTESTLIELSGTSIKIGNQEWMTENVGEVKFRNGDVITQAKSKDEWLNLFNKGIPAYCFNDFKAEDTDKFGKRYNWFAMNDSRGIAPAGWRVPNYNDWKELIDFINNDPTFLCSKDGWKDTVHLEKLKKSVAQNKTKFNAIPNNNELCETCFLWSFNGSFSEKAAHVQIDPNFFAIHESTISNRESEKYSLLGIRLIRGKENETKEKFANNDGNLLVKNNLTEKSHLKGKITSKQSNSKGDKLPFDWMMLNTYPVWVHIILWGLMIYGFLKGFGII
jgi:uncharacterized protein (TIGR02145 family)